jgi:nucleoside-diphosphate-sugar epimerase
LTEPEIPAESGTTLITGASGFIGMALAHRLAGERPVLCFSRHKPDELLPFVKGEFHSFEDLRQLDRFEINCVVHLAAATGGCSEEDGLAINVQGTRRLLRYALDRGCRKFVLASSIAAVGCLNKEFLPEQLPIPDEHPCLALDAYGLSKGLVEEVTRYFSRVAPDADFINLRLGSVDKPDRPPVRFSAAHLPELPFVELAHVSLADVLQALQLAVDAPHRPGVRVFNVVGAEMNTTDPVAQVLEAALGPRFALIDTGWYSQPGCAFDPIYSTRAIEKELGFVSGKPARI